MKNIFISFLIMLGLCALTATTNAQTIDLTETVDISGTQQVIRIKGNSDQQPVLLFLNGGPGDSVTDQIDQLFGELQKNFIVVLWDQRQTGQTAKINQTKAALSQALFEQDTYQLIQYLLQKFEREQLVLAAHSYGTSLGFAMAKNYPTLIQSFITINPMVHQVASEQMTLEMLKAQAKNRNDRKATEELSQVTIPFKTAQDLYYARKWLFDFEGKGFAKKKAFKNRVFSWSATWLPLFNEASQQNLFESTTRLGCPVLFIVGEKDFQTNTSLTQKYYDALQAPQKKIQVIENAGHLIPFEHNLLFQKIVIEYVSPG